MIKKHIYTLLLLFLGCSSANIQVARIYIKGSDTMLVLSELLAEEYMKNHPGISIYVEGGGTAAGLKALTRGEIDICTASRTIKAEEIKILAEKFGSIGISYIIAKDALSVYVNPRLGIRNFSLAEINKIFSGEISNWEELGGDNAPIIPVIRDINSGTHLYFKQHVLEGKEYSVNSQTKPTTNSIIEAVTKNKYSIGYGGIGYGENIVHAEIDGISPTEENVNNNSYPLIRYLYFYTVNTPNRDVSNFIDWIISKEGQEIVRRIGYIPIWKSSY